MSRDKNRAERRLDKKLEDYSKVTGGILAGTGAALKGFDLLAKKKWVDKNLSEQGKKEALNGMVKNSGKVGTRLLVVGAPLLGYSAYKHYKNKKKK